jgi:hypothetical protein
VSRIRLLAPTAVLLALACANGAGSGAGPSEIPQGSPLARIEAGMRGKQVLAILGEPDDRHIYMTDKAWRLFYWGRDTHRAEWVYRGVGSVVFRVHQRSGALEVINVVPDPGEPAPAPEAVAD